MLKNAKVILYGWLEISNIIYMMIMQNFLWRIEKGMKKERKKEKGRKKERKDAVAGV